jgi:hypothetical protein
MTDRSFTTAITVPQGPAAVFAAIQNMGAWWAEIDGAADNVGDTFTHRYKDAHRCKLVVKEMVTNEKIVWSVVEHYFSFTENKAPWLGTTLVFDIAGDGDQTQLTFTHVGLVPEEACYHGCASGWTRIIQGALKDVITAGGRNDVASA